jgi:carbamoyl-phosphate synthase/aspartate carbamoyltransferase
MFSSFSPHSIPRLVLKQAKQLGFSDRQIGNLTGTSEMAIRKIRLDFQIRPFVKQIDTVAAEFPSHTNYLYMTYNASEHDISFDDHGAMVLGSGVYRIGSSVEFDWCAVRTVRTLRNQGFKTIMVNYNPETVSTDYDEADRLYFENITLEKVLDIYELEGSNGVFVSMGGQTPNNIALSLYRQNVKIYGTSPDQIDGAENRYKFSRMCDSIGVDQPRWKELTSMAEATGFCEMVGYPVLVRPSYVLSGAAMNVVYSAEDLENYLLKAVAVSQDHPVVISKFIEEAKEIEMDAVAQNGSLVFHVISEHVENAGVHSGDATLVLPPQDLEPETVRKIEDATRKIANALNVTGPVNIQFIAKNNEIKVIECNLRASRSFPFVSKVLGVDMIEMATKAMIGIPFEVYPPVDVPKSDYVCVKVPQFSFSRLSGADPVLGVEMASTGEVACFGKDKFEAYLKALLSTGFIIPKANILLSIGSFKEKQEFLPSVWKLHRLGFNLFATAGTADFISEHGIPVKILEQIDGDEQKAEYNLAQHLSNHLIDLYINLPSRNRYRRPANYMSKGYRTRRMAVDLSVPLITNVKCAKLFVEAISRKTNFSVSTLDYQTSHRIISMPGLIDVSTFLPSVFESKSALEGTKAAIASGFTSLCILPYGTTNNIQTAEQLQLCQGFCLGQSLCDYRFSLMCCNGKSEEYGLLKDDVVSLFVSLNDHLTNISQVTNQIKAWPSNGCIIVEASGTELASLLFVTNLHGRPIHVTGIGRAEDIELIALSKQNGVKVTCDVPVYNLFLSRADFPGSQLLGTVEDIETLWANLEHIDCFSSGSLPYRLAMEQNLAPEKLSQTQFIGLEDTLPLLLTALSQKRLTLKDIQDRLYTNPRSIFGIHEQISTSIEVEIDRQWTVPNSGLESVGCGWTPLAGRKLFGKVCRVVLRGQPIYIDGAFSANGTPFGKELKTGPLPAVPTIVRTERMKSEIIPIETSSAPMTSKPKSLETISEHVTLQRQQRIEKALEKVEMFEKTLQRGREMSIDRSGAMELPR